MTDEENAEMNAQQKAKPDVQTGRPSLLDTYAPVPDFFYDDKREIEPIGSSSTRVRHLATVLYMSTIFVLFGSLLYNYMPAQRVSQEYIVTSEWPARLLVFGDSRDWFIWSEWCTLQAFNLTRVCKEFDLTIPCSHLHTDLICLRPDGKPAVIMWLFYGVALSAPYHVAYDTSHKIAGVPSSTPSRLEFLFSLSHRLFPPSGDEKVIFASNLWDAKRMKDLNISWDEGMWLKNATVAISQLPIKEGKSVFILTCQNVHMPHVGELNQAMHKLSDQLGVPLIDADNCTQHLAPSMQFRDKTHPSTISALRIALCVTNAVGLHINTR